MGLSVGSQMIENEKIKKSIEDLCAVTGMQVLFCACLSGNLCIGGRNGSDG